MWDWIAAACTGKILNTWKLKMGGKTSGLEILEDYKLIQIMLTGHLFFTYQILRNKKKRKKEKKTKEK